MSDSKRANNNLYELPWYMKGQPYDDGGQRKSTNNIRVKFCEKCNMAWEFDRYSTDIVLRYHDFPKYGISKEICNDCC